MAVTVTEKLESRQSTSGENPQVSLVYIIAGTEDDLLAKSSLAAATPALYDGLTRQSLQIEPVGPELWTGTVHYGPLNPNQAVESTFSFDTGGGSQHLTQSLQTVGTYPSGAPNCGGAIGVTQDRVEGVDITVPVYQFSETHYLPASQVTEAYRGTLFRLTGKVNTSAFRGLAAGECLFLGASGSRRGTGAEADWEISFKFAGSPNVTGLTVGTISGINKKGWQYLWVRYQDSVDANVLVQKPIGVYVEKVYEEGDFSTLGIGT